MPATRGCHHITLRWQVPHRDEGYARVAMTDDRREFSRRCENLISELPIAFPFELTTFLGAVGEQLGHPLELWRMNQVGSKRTGLLLRMIPQNIVCVVRGTTPAHLRHIAFHELGHLLLEHGGNRECSLPGT